MTNDKQKIQFLVHADSDTVGVATVDVRAGETVQGSYLHSQRRIELDALDDIPLGHKIALEDHGVEGAVIEYGHDIGRVVAPIERGRHVHTHNLKTKRW